MKLFILILLLLVLPVHATTMQLQEQQITFQDLQFMPEQQIKGFNVCSMQFITREEIIIRTQEEYEEILRLHYQEAYQTFKMNPPVGSKDADIFDDVSFEEYYEACNTYPPIDFSRYTLLGKYADDNICNFEKKVYFWEKGLSYTIIDTDAGYGCAEIQPFCMTQNLILVSKIPDDVEYSTYIREVYDPPYCGLYGWWLHLWRN